MGSVRQSSHPGVLRALPGERTLFAARIANNLQGAVHLVLFLAYVVLVFD